MSDFEPNDLRNTLTALKSDTQRVGLADASDVRRRGDHRTRTTAIVSSLSAVVLVAGAFGLSGGIGDENKRAVAPPANESKLEQTSLLVADELSTAGSTYQPTATGQGDTQLVTSCPEAKTGPLDAEMVWHRTFTNHNADPGVEPGTARHVAIQFSSRAKAAAAFETIDSWFKSCSKGEGPFEWLPVAAEAGSEVRNAFFKEWVNADEDRWEFASFGIRGNAITVLSFTLIGQNSIFTENPLEAPMLFALERLAGTRTATENTVPEDFRFAGIPELSTGEDRTVERFRHLGWRWLFSGCDSRGLRAVDGARYGMDTVTVSGSDAYRPLQTLQLAVYRDVDTARRAAEELKGQTSDCEGGPETGVLSEEGFTADNSNSWTISKTHASPDVHVAWAANKDEFAYNLVRHPGTALAVVQRGTAVLAVTVLAVTDPDHIEDLQTNEMPSAAAIADAKSAALQAARDTAVANLDRMCEVADCE